MQFNNTNNFQREKLTDQRIASLWYLAFWSNPAWFRVTKRSSLTDAAIKEWVAYHRLSIATKKETVAEIIGSVKQVIPNSKLSKYGDYSYDIDYEDLCCVSGDLDPKSHIFRTDKSANDKRYDFWASEIETNISGTRDNDLYPACNGNKITDFNRIRSLSEWLKELNRVLINVRQIANEAQLLDSWTETLLKFCLRFVCILRNNENLTKLLSSEISFIIDYEKLRKMPISKIELQSIPQPENRRDIFLDNRSIDALWLKLASPEIRNIWKKDSRTPFPFDNENQRSENLIPLIKINFLRSHKSRSFYFSRQAVEAPVDIPKNKETEFLGSLLNFIHEDSLESGDTSTKMDDATDNYFPQAHGEWTKQLFPHRINLNAAVEKNSAVWKPWSAALNPQVSDSAVNLESGHSEIARFPIQFYKFVPPPTLATRFRPPCMYSQHRNRLVYIPPNNVTSNSSNHQLPHKVSATPISNVLPTTYVSQSSLSQNYISSQRLPAYAHSGITGQYHRGKFLRAPYQHYHTQSTKELLNYPSKTDENPCPEKTSIENEEKDLNEEKHVRNNEETSSVNNIPVPFVQLSHGYNIPFRIQQNEGNAIGNTNSTPQSVISNPQLQVHEARQPLKMNYPITSIRLRTPLIQNMLPVRNPYILPQFTSKPRFLGPITMNNIKRMQERLFQQRQQYDYMNGSSIQDIQKSATLENVPLHLEEISLGYEDKVEKWLESINKYVKFDSFVNLEELPELSDNELHEFSNDELSDIPNVELPELPNIELPKLPNTELPNLPNIELPDVYDKSNEDRKSDCEKSDKWQDENTSEVPELKLPCLEIKSPINTLTNIDGKFQENKINNLKHKKIKAKKEFFEHLQPIQDIVPKLRTKKFKRKIKIVKKYFAGISPINARFYCERFIKILGTKNTFIKNVGFSKRKEYSTFRQKYCLGIFHKQLPLADKNFDMHQSNLLINDVSKFKVLIRESQEFNTFPSKRMKLNKLHSSFFETESFIRDERSRWISSLNYFDSIIDELFSLANGIEGICEKIGNRNKMMNGEIHCWTHFKVAVKTLMKNTISSLETQISQNL